MLSIEHIGSAHSDDELALLLQVAEERRHAGQLTLDLDGAGVGGTFAVVEGTSSLILWEVLNGLYDHLGLDRLGDETFRALVLARVIEPTSKADTVRVLTEIGVTSPHRVTFMRCLKRVVERDYRAAIAQACHRHVSHGAGLAVVLYDVTTLHFEIEREDALRKVGMSKERRVDPQVTVGLLTTGDGFPLEVDLFEGNKAETKTLIPVPTQFRERQLPSRRGDDRDHPTHGQREECPRPAGGLPLRVQTSPARPACDQRHGGTRREGRRR